MTKQENIYAGIGSFQREFPNNAAQTPFGEKRLIIHMDSFIINY